MDLRALNFLMSDLSDTSELLPVVVFAILNLRRPSFQFLRWFFFVSAAVKMVSLITMHLSFRNHFLYHFLAVWQVVFVFCYIDFLNHKKINMPVVLLLIAVNVLNSIFIEPPSVFNSLAWSFNTFFLLCAGLLYYYETYKTIDTSSEINPHFIIVSGFMIYFSGSLFTYGLSWKILTLNPTGFFANAWIIQSSANLLKNLIISYGLWRAKPLT